MYCRMSFLRGQVDWKWKANANLKWQEECGEGWRGEWDRNEIQAGLWGDTLASKVLSAFLF